MLPLIRICAIWVAFSLVLNQAYSADFYWIGGSGEWDDVGHWATTSGGTTIHFGIPSASDDVFFDANSFLSSNDTIDLLQLTAQCRSLTVSTPLSPTLVGGGGTGKLSIHGNFSLSQSFNWAYGGSVEFRGDLATNTLITEGKTIGSAVTILGNAAGSFSIIGDLVTRSSVILQEATVSFSVRSTIRTARVVITGNGAGDYSNLSIESTDEVQLTLLPTEAPTVANLRVSIIAAYPEIRVGGTAPLKLGVVYLEAPRYNARIGRSYANIGTTSGLVLDSLTLVGHGYFSLPVTTGYLSLEENSSHSFTANATLEVAEMKAVGTCTTPIYLNGGPTNFIANASAVLNLENLVVEDISVSGGSNWDAIESSGAGAISGWNFISAFGPDRYWVGGSGEWNQQAHWSYTSGGAGGACIPKTNNNVIFDANSFTSGDTVYVKDGRFTANTLDYRASAPEAYLLHDGGNLTLYGSVLLSPNITWSRLNGGEVTLQLRGPATGRVIQSSGRTQNLSLNLDGPGGDWQLVDSLPLSNQLRLVEGTLFTRGNPIELVKFEQRSSGVSAVYLEDSRIHLRDLTGGSSFLRPEIELRNEFYAEEASFYHHSSDRPATVNLSNAVGIDQFDRLIGEGFINLRSSRGIDANLVSCKNGATFNLFGNIDTLLFSSGATYTLDGNSTQTLTLEHLEASGDCINPIQFTSSNGFSLFSSNDQYVDFLQLSNIGVGGSAWTANSSSDLGGNSGWTFTGGTSARTLYWVGGNGYWYDPSHWSLTDGGLGGECPPTRIDDVIVTDLGLTALDTINFSDASGTSTLNPECNTFDASTITSAAVLSGRFLTIYGSFYLSPSIFVGFQTLLLEGTDLDEELSVHSSFPRTLTLNNTGTYTLVDPLICPGMSVTLNAGVFNTSNFNVDIREINFRRNDPVLDMGSTQMIIQDQTLGVYMLSCGNCGIRGDGTHKITFAQGNSWSRFSGTLQGLNIDMAPGGTSRLEVSGPRTPTGPDFGKVHFGGAGVLQGLMSIDSLLLTKPFPFTIANSNTTNGLTITGELNAIGSACSPIPIAQAIGAPQNSIINFSSTATAAMDYVRIDRIDAGGLGDALAGRNSVNVAGRSNGWRYETLNSVRSLDRFFLGPDLNTCENTPTLTPSVPIAFVADYSWSDGSNNQSFTPPSAGSYWLDITFEAGTCTVRDSIVITAPAYDLDSDTTVSGCGNTEVRVNNPNPAGSGYRWIAEIGAINATTATSAELAVPGIYFLEQTLGPCTDSTRYTVDAGTQVTSDSIFFLCGPTTISTALSSYFITQDTSFSESFSAFNGCDSMRTYTATVQSSLPSSDSLLSGCAPLSFTSAGGFSYLATTDTTLVERFNSFRGCDSLRRYTVTITGTPTMSLVTDYVCSAGPYTTGLTTYTVTQDTSFSESYTSASACDSTVNYFIEVASSVPQSDTSIIWCGPRALTTGLATYSITRDTSFSESYTSFQGCDSLRRYSIVIDPSGLATSTSLLWCAPDVLSTPLQNYSITQDTTVTESFTSIQGCDSTHQYVVEIVSGPIESDSIMVGCGPQQLNTAQRNYLITQDTVIRERFSNFQGCDSVRRYIVTINAPSSGPDSLITWCTPRVLSTAAGDYTISGDSIITEKFLNVSGCDSTRSYLITVTGESFSSDLEYTLCEEGLVRLPFDDVYVYSDTVIQQPLLSFLGCDSTVNHSVTIPPAPALESLVSLEEANCFGERPFVALSLPQNVAPSGQWIFSDTLDVTPSGAYLPSNGQFDFSLLYGDDCKKDTSLFVLLPDSISIDLPDTILAERGALASLIANPTGGTGSLTMSWQAPSDVARLDCTFCPGLSFTAIQSGLLSLEVIDSLGCSRVQQAFLEVNRPGSYFLPTAISPNGDGVNDFLAVYSGESIEVRDLKVFDRWGNVHYASDDKLFYSGEPLWDASSARDGVYVVLMDIQWPNGAVKTITGDVNVFR